MYMYRLLGHLHSELLYNFKHHDALNEVLILLVNTIVSEVHHVVAYALNVVLVLHGGKSENTKTPPTNKQQPKMSTLQILSRTVITYTCMV